ncbi:MAG: hypothetical protein ABL940_09310 [Bacteroidia bacterium]
MVIILIGIVKRIASSLSKATVDKNNINTMNTECKDSINEVEVVYAGLLNEKYKTINQPIISKKIQKSSSPLKTLKEYITDEPKKNETTVSNADVEKQNKRATLSLAFSIASIVFMALSFVMPFAVLISILFIIIALILSIITLIWFKKNKNTGVKIWPAVVALIISIIPAFLFTLFMFALINGGI